jgi:aminoglycoside phosphotransferase (APT) family kinase protein
MTNASAFDQLILRLDPAFRLLRAWPLTGGVSAQVTALEIERPDGSVFRAVARLHGAVDLARNPAVAATEYRLLALVTAHGVAAPRPLLLDDTCELFPAPVIVIEFIDGATDFEPVDLSGYLSQMAVQLARIHAVPAAPALHFLPRKENVLPPPSAALDHSMSEDRIRAALEGAAPLTPRNTPVVLHGDYWPGNVLWRDGQLAAIIDWEDAAAGDPLADLSNCRLELLWWFGPDAMHAFTHSYLTLHALDTADLAYWDLRAALLPCGRLGSWGLDASTETRMRERHAWFVTQALESQPAR